MQISLQMFFSCICIRTLLSTFWKESDEVYVNKTRCGSESQDERDFMNYRLLDSNEHDSQARGNKDKTWDLLQQKD